MGKAVKVSDDVYSKLNHYAGVLRSKVGRPVSVNEVIANIIKEYEKMKRGKK